MCLQSGFPDRNAKSYDPDAIQGGQKNTPNSHFGAGIPGGCCCDQFPFGFDGASWLLLEKNEFAFSCFFRGVANRNAGAYGHRGAPRRQLTRPGRALRRHGPWRGTGMRFRYPVATPDSPQRRHAMPNLRTPHYTIPGPAALKSSPH